MGFKAYKIHGLGKKRAHHWCVKSTAWLLYWGTNKNNTFCFYLHCLRTNKNNTFCFYLHCLTFIIADILYISVFNIVLDGITVIYVYFV